MKFSILDAVFIKLGVLRSRREGQQHSVCPNIPESLASSNGTTNQNIVNNTQNVFKC